MDRGGCSDDKLPKVGEGRKEHLPVLQQTSGGRGTGRMALERQEVELSGTDTERSTPQASYIPHAHLPTVSTQNIYIPVLHKTTNKITSTVGYLRVGSAPEAYHIANFIILFMLGRNTTLVLMQ